MSYVVRVILKDKNTNQSMSSYFLTFSQAYELIFSFSQQLKDRVEFNIGMIKVDQSSKEYILASKNYEDNKKREEND